MHSYIIVPDGVAADATGTPLSRPSFVYRQVLDYTLSIARSGDWLYLAPANRCGPTTEHTLAHTYLIKKNREDLQIYCPQISPAHYVDTYGNAILLKQLLGRAVTEAPCELICASLHSYRAAYCFRKIGFHIRKVHRVHYRTTGEAIMPRWWYYNYKPIHCIYEILAFIRDIFQKPAPLP